MDDRIAGDKRQKLGIVRGGQYGRRPDRSQPRRHAPPDQWLDRETLAVFTTWKADDGEGEYGSRGIANAAHGLTHPLRVVGRRIREAEAAGVPFARVRWLIDVLWTYAGRVYRHEPSRRPAA